MYVDDPMILELVALLKAHGVYHAVIAPGSRHYPIVRSLEADSDFHLYSVVDERSAGFFAIGIIRATNAPVAVLTTSGTAAVNLASAVADAYYQRLPLVAITADRLPEFLNQMEDQMLDQTRLFAGTVRARALLRPVRDGVDRWYDNRVINEALLALRVNGTGPVHINVPVNTHMGLTYTAQALPAVRVIKHHGATASPTEWSDIRERMQGKRVLILWGQGDRPEKDLSDAVDAFTSRTDSLLVADHLGNIHHYSRLPRAFPTLQLGLARRGALIPDIVVTLGGTLFLIENVKELLRDHEIEHWRVDPDGRVVDPFRQLTDVFQMTPIEFFNAFAQYNDSKPDTPFRKSAIRLSRRLPPLPSEFGELTAIGTFLEHIPSGAALHIANSSAMRMAHLYELDPSVTVLGNRGVNGIDGSMSSAVGYAVASGQLTFLIIGDLSFLYDMNSLSIRGCPSNLRILLLNNGGGALMHAPLPAGRAKQTTRHISAGHTHSARGWVESLGISYLHAKDSKELKSALELLLIPSSSAPILLEVFTDKLSDIEQLKSYYSLTSSIGASTYRKVRQIGGRALRKLRIHA